LIEGELILREARLAEESLDSDGDGLLALEDLVGLMEAGGGEEKLHDLREAFAWIRLLTRATLRLSVIFKYIK